MRLVPFVALVGCIQPAFEPTLANIQAEVFTPSCALGSSCHSGSGLAGDLDLSEGVAHASLVGVAASEAEGWTRVVPGDAEASLLVAALRAPVGDVRRMPPGFALNEGVIQAISEWVDAGAADR